MSSAEVAVIIPAHNRSDLLAITLKNVVAQTHRDLDIIVIDDASSDDTPAIISEWLNQDSRIRTQRFGEPGGACRARNAGLGMTEAPYICLLDSDDLMHPDKVAMQLDELRKEADLDAIVCQMAHFEHDPNEAELLWNTFAGDHPRRRFLGHEPVWGIHAPLWRREVLVSLGGLDESLSMAQDYDLHLRALLRGVRFRLRPQLLTYCRRHKSQAISTSRSLPRLRTLLSIFRDSEKLIDDDERPILATNYVWLAKQAGGWRDSELVDETCDRAAKLGLKVPLSFRLNCKMAAWTGRHRFLRWATDWADRARLPWRSREEWFCAHRIVNEPGIEVFPVPRDSF